MRIGGGHGEICFTTAPVVFTTFFSFLMISWCSWRQSLQAPWVITFHSSISDNLELQYHDTGRGLKCWPCLSSLRTSRYMRCAVHLFQPPLPHACKTMTVLSLCHVVHCANQTWKGDSLFSLSHCKAHYSIFGLGDNVSKELSIGHTDAILHHPEKRISSKIKSACRHRKVLGTVGYLVGYCCPQLACKFLLVSSTNSQFGNKFDGHIDL